MGETNGSTTTAPPRERGSVLGVLGASGGVGASTLAAACAVRSARVGWRSVLVDGDPWGGGIDLLVALDGAPGLRWADLTRARGEIDGPAFLQALPTGAAGYSVLSWGRQPPDGDVEDPAQMVTALSTAADLVVIDLPRHGAAGPDLRSACDAVVLLVRNGVSGLAAALSTVAALRPDAVVSGPGPRALPLEHVEAALGHPVLTELTHDPQVEADLVRGAPVGGGRVLREAADLVLASLLPRLARTT